MSYAIYFTDDKATYRLPVNPEELEETITLASEEFEVLKLGQIVVPTYLELRKYSFECELPNRPYNYVETPNKFKNADYYIGKFKRWMKTKLPVQFIASNETSNEINILVLIEELVVTERAGEEGDKYVQISLIEYRPFNKLILPLEVNRETGKKTKTTIATANPKSTGYHVVVKGDTLWSIAKKYYGDGSKCNIIFNANKDKIKNPNIISIGQKLFIPTSDEFSKYSAALPVTKTTTATKAKTVTLATQKATVGERPVAGISMLLDSIGG